MQKTYNPKPLFEQRMRKLLKGEADYKQFLKYSQQEPINSIRCNTLKISEKNLIKKFKQKNWKINQPFSNYPQAIVIESPLHPGEIGKSPEHILGEYYVQELVSMLPIIALNPQPEHSFLDLCASPGSKTTQTACHMKNSGILIANDKDIRRLKILISNLERCGVTNTIITQHDGSNLCEKLKKINFTFNKILTDVPCSGEGTIRSSPKTFLMWNIKVIKKLSRLQKKLASSSLEILKPNGEMIYSTCTFSPEENEEVIDYLLKNFNIQVEKINLPLKTRPGITKWNNKEFHKDVKLCHRIYPQDNNTEGFFLCKLRKISD